MKAERRLELLSRLKNEFDDYLDYYDLMECLPGIKEDKVESLKRRRTVNGLEQISFFTHRNKGALLVSASKFEEWVKGGFRPLTASNDDA